MEKFEEDRIANIIDADATFKSMLADTTLLPSHLVLAINHSFTDVFVSYLCLLLQNRPTPQQTLQLIFERLNPATNSYLLNGILVRLKIYEEAYYAITLNFEHLRSFIDDSLLNKTTNCVYKDMQEAYTGCTIPLITIATINDCTRIAEALGELNAKQ
jgi:hypothetical protein